jgi:hypothetical protein|tara:strand:+ start:410 stop:640 length:231 start_codon:yes stop_codon:yes gene_type:complete
VVEHQLLLRKVAVVMVEDQIQAHQLPDLFIRVVMELLDMVAAEALVDLLRVDLDLVEVEVLVSSSSLTQPDKYLKT